jgi:hypothetical protein
VAAGVFLVLRSWRGSRHQQTGTQPGVAPLLIQSRGDRHCHRCNLLNRGLRRLEHVHETASELHGDIHCHNSQHQADHQFHAYGELYGEAIVFGEIHRMKS